jgi:hypothetical protein
VAGHRHVDSLTNIILKRLGSLEARVVRGKQVDKPICGRLHHLMWRHTESIERERCARKHRLRLVLDEYHTHQHHNGEGGMSSIFVYTSPFCRNNICVASSNAGLQQPKARPDDGQHALTQHQTAMREGYAETGERGFGLLQGIVRTPCDPTPKTFYTIAHGTIFCQGLVVPRDSQCGWRFSPRQETPLRPVRVFEHGARVPADIGHCRVPAAGAPGTRLTSRQHLPAHGRSGPATSRSDLLP